VKTLRWEINKRRRKFKALHVALQRSAQLTAGKGSRIQLRWRFKTRAWKTLQTSLLGKTILFTDRAGWSDEQSVRAYRSQAHVESAFRAMKDPHFLSFRPTHHWTEEKLRVHALY